MSEPAILPLARDQLKDAFALSSGSGWNQRLEDWHMLLRLAPRGCFGALSGRRVVGTAIGIDYGGFGWIAMMLVDPGFRSRGLGGRLLEAAMGEIPSGRPIRLDATPLGRPLYKRYGFVDEALLTRHVAPLGLRVAEDTAPDGVRRVDPSDLSSIAGLDAAIFGGDRRRLLEWARQQAPEYARAAFGGSGPMQYCLGRPGRLFDQIGPVVASDDETAKALVASAALSAGGRSMVIDSFDARVDFGLWLRAVGFRADRPLFRMVRPAGVAPAAPLPSTVVEYAILGPEFA